MNIKMLVCYFIQQHLISPIHRQVCWNNSANEPNHLLLLHRHAVWPFVTFDTKSKKGKVRNLSLTVPPGFQDVYDDICNNDK